MSEFDSKLKTCFGDNINYEKYYNLLKHVPVVNFKRNEDLVEITEHVGDLQIEHGINMYKDILRLNMLDTNTIHRLIQINDMVGNPYLPKVIPCIPGCSPNSIKYVYFGLLVVRDILEKKLDNIEFIEIGGGYGGQCVILHELFRIFNIHVTKYKLIDLDNVVQFQHKYVKAFQMQNDCEFIPFESYKEHTFSKDSYLLSSYCLSELTDDTRKDYYENLVQQIPHGLVIWNNPFCVDLPKSYQEISHSCSEIVGKFLTF